MHLSRLTAIIAALAASVTAAAIPASADTSSTSEYVTGFPICGVKGFTEVPGNYTQTTHQQPGATLESCLRDCRQDPTCKSISYAAVYTGCYFYDHFTCGVQLIADNTSYFDHYDEVCYHY